LNAGKSSGANFDDQEDDVLWPDIGDDSDVGEGTCVTDCSFLWKDLDNYIGHPAAFTAISGLNNWTSK
jgi:hypothetical protein